MSTTALQSRPAGRWAAREWLAPINVWAAIGALALAFIAFVLIRWITGPLFTPVHTGPDTPPAFMKANLIFWEVVSLPAALALIYRFVIRPWRRERAIGVDGLLVMAYATIWFQDPLSDGAGQWFTYNSYLVNFGSWANSVPGWSTYGTPGHMLVEPILVIPALYVYFFWIAATLGSRLMRATKRRWPQLGTAGVVAICFGAVLGIDLVLEGLLWMPGGLWALPGGHGSVLFAGSYDQFTANEWILVSLTLTAGACVRYFVDDRGRSIAERGSERLHGRIGVRALAARRVLATVGVMQVVMLCCYTLPQTLISASPAAWPAALQKRSYFTDGLCGPATPRACPGTGHDRRR
jgi:Spirocyclase AveC-like